MSRQLSLFQMGLIDDQGENVSEQHTSKQQAFFGLYNASDQGDVSWAAHQQAASFLLNLQCWWSRGNVSEQNTSWLCFKFTMLLSYTCFWTCFWATYASKRVSEHAVEHLMLLSITCFWATHAFEMLSEQHMLLSMFLSNTCPDASKQHMVFELHVLLGMFLSNIHAFLSMLLKCF